MYEVQAEGNARARKRILHRNMLMPSEELLLNKDEDEKPKQKRKKTNTKQPSTTQTNDQMQRIETVNEHIDSARSTENSDSEDEYEIITHNETVVTPPHLIIM